MSGVELALAITPLVIATISPLAKASKAFFASRRNSEQTNELLDFYDQLKTQILMLQNTLRRLAGDTPYDDDEALQQRADQVLGKDQEAFKHMLELVLRSVNDVVSDKSLGLERMVRKKRGL